MLPVAIRNLIEAYGMDMAYLDEMNQLVLKSSVMEKIDRKFAIKIIMQYPDLFEHFDPQEPLKFAFALVFLEERGLIDIECICEALEKCDNYRKTDVSGWVLDKMDYLYDKRIQVWKDVGYRVVVMRGLWSDIYLVHSLFLYMAREFCDEFYYYLVEKEDTQNLHQ